jgi:hypothetical protein
MLKSLRHIVIFFAFLTGVLSNGFAHALVHDGSKISVEKSVEGQYTLKAWEGLINVADRKTVHSLETVSNHINETNKTPRKIADEIAQSGNYEKWLSDHFVTYEKNGFKLDKTSIDFQFANHLDKVENITSNLVKGGHNKTEFFKKVYDPTNNPTQRVLVLSQQNLGQQGWSLIEYKTYQIDGSGNLLIPLQLNAGNSSFKTVYDPLIVSQSSIKKAGYESFKDAIDNGKTGINYPNDFQGLSNGVTYTGFFNQSGKTIITWYVK